MPPIVAQYAQIAQNFLQTINWSHPSWDLVLILFFVVSSIVYGIAMGRDRSIIALVAVYMAIAISSYLPDVMKLIGRTNFANVFALRMTLFTGVFALFFFLISQSALMKHLGSATRPGGAIAAIVISLLHMGLLTSVIFSYLPQNALEVFTPQLQSAFLTDTARVAWVVAPIILLVITGGMNEYGRHHDRG